jgi:hypothetical protein
MGTDWSSPSPTQPTEGQAQDWAVSPAIITTPVGPVGAAPTKKRLPWRPSPWQMTIHRHNRARRARR